MKTLLAGIRQLRDRDLPLLPPSQDEPPKSRYPWQRHTQDYCQQDYCRQKKKWKSRTADVSLHPASLGQRLLRYLTPSSKAGASPTAAGVQIGIKLVTRPDADKDARRVDEDVHTGESKLLIVASFAFWHAHEADAGWVAYTCDVARWVVQYVIYTLVT